MVRVERAREDIYPVVEAVGMWESRRDFQRVWKGWEAGFMAFRAFHTLSFPWPAFRPAMLDNRYVTERNAPHTPRNAHRNRVSMSASAIMHKSRDTLGCDYSANCMMSPLIVPIDHLPRNSRKSLITWLIFTFCPISVLASVRDP